MKREDWCNCIFEDLLHYEQPTRYIVDSTEYDSKFKTPVLTAGKTFIIGYTNEVNGIFDNLPVIIFDDFTTSSQFVNFPFKVKSSAMKILLPSTDLVNIKFLFFLMQATRIRNDTHKRYWISEYAKKSLLLPPLSEQRAIVAKIEQLFSDLDNGIADLKKAREQLKIYRQAVLKKAFSGELTREWREKQTDLPTAEELLTQIKEERRRYHEKQLEDWQASLKKWEADGQPGKKPPKPSALKDVNSTEKEDKIILNTLPTTWCWQKLGNITIVSGGLTKDSKRNCISQQKPFLRVANVYFNQLLLDEIHSIGIKDSEIDRVLLKKNDLLIVEGNGSATQIGRVAIWGGEIKDCIHQNHLIKARPFKIAIAKYLLNFLCSKQGRDFIVSEASSTSGLYTLNLSKIANLKIPFCSFKEQNQIVQEIESRLSVCDKVEQIISESLEKAEALRQSILKKAFEGRLLSDAELEACRREKDYEPASELLKKIKAEKLRNREKK